MSNSTAAGPAPAPDRLDSWKAIAQYLGRDERTVRRWEKTLGLPVRRVPGGRGHSVFAYVGELEAWLRARDSAAADVPAAADPPSPASSGPAPPADSVSTAPVDRLPAATRPSRYFAWIAAAIVVAVSAGTWALASRRPGSDRLSVRLTPDAVVGSDASGGERWRYLVSERERHIWLDPPQVLNGGAPGVLAAASMRIDTVTGAEHGGQIYWLTPDGSLARTWTLNDRFAFTTKEYGPPWVITDVQVSPRPSGRLLAVTAHHHNWWPGLVVLLDAAWNRVGTFVNAGWIEQVRWIDASRLVASGFSNDRDAGMIALLDATALAAQSPPPEDDDFRCLGCGESRPQRYVAFPRSEVNRAAGAPFNRAYLQVVGTRVLIRTMEVDPDAARPADAIYELAPDLTVVSASFSDRYWEEHRALEAKGTLNHDRAHCPDKDGPREIDVWEARTGWQRVGISR